MNWQTTYPSLAAVNEAGFQTLATWLNHLPAPQTDVERTVHRRIAVRWKALGDQMLHEQHPEIAQRLDALRERLQRLL